MLIILEPGSCLRCSGVMEDAATIKYGILVARVLWLSEVVLTKGAMLGALLLVCCDDIVL